MCRLGFSSDMSSHHLVHGGHSWSSAYYSVGVWIFSCACKHDWHGITMQPAHITDTHFPTEDRRSSMTRLCSTGVLMHVSVGCASGCGSVSMFSADAAVTAPRGWGSKLCDCARKRRRECASPGHAQAVADWRRERPSPNSHHGSER